jgi:nucleotide-binding universal stress UspA family protein
MIALENVLVATDFGSASDTAIRYGRALAERFGAKLHVLHVSPDAYLTAAMGYAYAKLRPVGEEVSAPRAAAMFPRTLLSSESVWRSREAAVAESQPGPTSLILELSARRHSDAVRRLCVLRGV